MTEAKTREKPKLSVIPKGHWRNLWRSTASTLGTTNPPCVCLGGSHWLGGMQHVSAEMAEQRAVYCEQSFPEKYGGVTYLGPVFFPDP